MHNKYDTNITLEDNSSLTYMLKNIEPGSTVLEFGPATGYMTRYLKEELKCLVYIVEIEKEAFEKARVYAQDGICGSAEDGSWCERFQGINFDYITFADVLEHLMNPWQVLEWSVKLLKKNTGRILVSIPNIGHNAVLIDLFNNKFEYRKTGIMDNTHLRFFTHDSAVEMFYKCGLFIVDEDAVVFDLDYTGLGNSSTDVPENVWDELRLREYGFINQFLFTLNTQKQDSEISNNKGTISYECALYFTDDLKYCEEQKILGSVQLSGNQFCANFIMEKEVKCKRVMIELFAFPGMIYDLIIKSDSSVECIDPINGERDCDSYYFWEGNIKIQIESSNAQTLSYVHVSGKLKTVQMSQLKQHISATKHEQIMKLQAEELEIERLNKVIIEKDKAIAVQNELLIERDKTVTTQNELLDDKETEIMSLNKSIDEKNNYIQKIQSTLWYRIFKKQIMKNM